MRRGIIESTRPDQYINATVAATGGASGSIGPCPEGFEWYVERLTCSQSGAAVAATALLEIYVQAAPDAPLDASKQGRQDVSVGSVVKDGVSDQQSPIVVPPGYHLVAVWSALTSGDKVKLSSQIQVRRLILESARGHKHGQLDYQGDHRKQGDTLRAEPIVVGDQLAEV